MDSSKPKWWMLYATVPLMLTGLFLILGSHWVEWAKTTGAVVVILATFVGMAVWTNANEGTIQRAELEAERRARAKRRRMAFAPRSRPFAVPESTKQVPKSGFGSARFRPTYTYELEPASGGHVRVAKRINSSFEKAY